jgi:uncharacterized protein YebE (UPF0316 family)
MTNINDYQYYNMILLLNSIFKIYYKVIYLYLAIKEISFDYKKISYIIFMSSLYEVLMLKFLQSDSIWIYFIIFFGKITEVTFATLRIVLINRGERVKGSLVALIEVFLWIYVTGTVLVGFQKAPLKVAVFVLAFALGNYLGSWLENKIALGLSTIEIITTDDTGNLVEVLRANNLGVTVTIGEGKEGAKTPYQWAEDIRQAVD